MKKAFHIIGILLVLLAAVFALPGCAEKDVRPLYTVTFISAEGETVKTDKVRRILGRRRGQQNGFPEDSDGR